ncbi:hypothetical protein LU196_00015 [Pantoea sp. Mb-10]|uniref:hypothetical protein n=1 Tax=unclassified Pantoea TaxID=2630326 RepID=UPI001E559B23|nr:MULTISPECIES: hypothetical protein [unclassified Pantoea]MCE0488451.1 hypothetical protein [Pantoea sp. Mb-10]MCE0500198.1 hypothetical protein [Pantoea sp. Pb-8]
MKDLLTDHIYNTQILPDMAISIPTEIAKWFVNKLLGVVEIIEAGRHDPILKVLH